MTPQEKEAIHAFGKTIQGGVRFGLHLPHEAAADPLLEFTRELEEAVPGAEVDRSETDPGEHPALVLSDGLRFQAVPLGGELQPFLEALAWAAGLRQGSDPGLEQTLSRVHLPASLKLYVTPRCPFCPAVLKTIVPFPFINPQVHLTVIDGDRFQEEAAADGVKSVPTMILDDRFRWTGVVKRDEILAILLERDPATLSADSLAGMLGDGRAKEVAALMQQSQAVFPSFIELLLHPQWPRRLAAMVAAEELASLDPELVPQLVEPLWARFEALDEARKGDMLYLLGELGAVSEIPRLKAIAAGPYEDAVKEAAEEALDMLEPQRGEG